MPIQRALQQSKKLKFKTQQVHETLFLVARSSGCPYLFHSAKRHAVKPEKTTALDQIKAEHSLKRLNQQFLDEHHHASQLKRLDIEYVLIYIGNELSLWQAHYGTYIKIKSACNPVANERYDRLKQVVHISVLISMILNELITHSSSTSKCLDKLRTIAKELRGLEHDIEGLFDLGDLRRQQDLIKTSLRTIQQIILGGETICLATLKSAYLRSVHDQIIENNKQAARTQLLDLDKLIEDWGLKNKARLDKTRIVIVGPHGPREGRIDIQYYEHLYKSVLGISDVLDNKVYHAEMLPSQMSGLDVLNDLILHFLLGSELNKSIGHDFLGDYKAMFSDVLKAHAPPILEQLFKPK